MNIKILGTKGQIPVESKHHRKHSGLIIDQEIMLDIGEEDFINQNPSHIFLSHLHPDHAFFLKYKKQFMTDSIIFSPETHPLIPEAMVINDPIMIKEYHVTPIKTIHSLNVQSQGYLVEKQGHSFFYSSDIVDIPQQERDKMNYVDAIITEASFFRKGGMVRKEQSSGKKYGHIGVKDIINLFLPFTSKIIFMHYGSWYIKNPHHGRKKILENAPSDLQICFAYDGMEIGI